MHRLALLIGNRDIHHRQPREHLQGCGARCLGRRLRCRTSRSICPVLGSGSTGIARGGSCLSPSGSVPRHHSRTRDQNQSRPSHPPQPRGRLHPGPGFPECTSARVRPFWPFRGVVVLRILISRMPFRPVPQRSSADSHRPNRCSPLSSGNKFSVESGQKQSSMLQEALKT